MIEHKQALLRRFVFIDLDLIGWAIDAGFLRGGDGRRRVHLDRALGVLRVVADVHLRVFEGQRLASEVSTLVAYAVPSTVVRIHVRRERRMAGRTSVVTAFNHRMVVARNVHWRRWMASEAMMMH